MRGLTTVAGTNLDGACEQPHRNATVAASSTTPLCTPFLLVEQREQTSELVDSPPASIPMPTPPTTSASSATSPRHAIVSRRVASWSERNTAARCDLQSNGDLRSPSSKTYVQLPLAFSIAGGQQTSSWSSHNGLIDDDCVSLENCDASDIEALFSAQQSMSTGHTTPESDPLSIPRAIVATAEPAASTGLKPVDALRKTSNLSDYASNGATTVASSASTSIACSLLASPTGCQQANTSRGFTSEIVVNPKRFSSLPQSLPGGTFNSGLRSPSSRKPGLPPLVKPQNKKTKSPSLSTSPPATTATLDGTHQSQNSPPPLALNNNSFNPPIPEASGAFSMSKNKTLRLCFDDDHHDEVTSPSLAPGANVATPSSSRSFTLSDGDEDVHEPAQQTSDELFAKTTTTDMTHPTTPASTTRLPAMSSSFSLLLESAEDELCENSSCGIGVGGNDKQRASCLNTKSPDAMKHGGVVSLLPVDGNNLSSTSNNLISVVQNHDGSTTIDLSTAYAPLLKHQQQQSATNAKPSTNNGKAPSSSSPQRGSGDSATTTGAHHDDEGASTTMAHPHHARWYLFKNNPLAEHVDFDGVSFS